MKQDFAFIFYKSILKAKIALFFLLDYFMIDILVF